MIVGQTFYRMVGFACDKPHYEAWVVAALTPCGAWIQLHYASTELERKKSWNTRWVRKNTNFIHTTQYLAYESAKYRAGCRLEHLERETNSVRHFISCFAVWEAKS